MPFDTWNLGFHIRSPKSWLNDPNGMCQFRGTYRFFYQYNDAWPHDNQKAWGQFASSDLVHWRYVGVSIEPSIPEDRHGVYSGCTVVERGAAADGGDRLRAYYTGNVICPGEHHNRRDVGFVNEGREGNTVTCCSDDGVSFGEKTVLLRPDDYPDFCSLHVRDPKVWEQDGCLHMVLGARDVGGTGICMLFDSHDGSSWSFRQAIRPTYPFGYMWECPNIVLLDGHEYLAFSPQGLPSMRDRWHNLWNAGYVPLGGRILDATRIDERDFVEWDHGHDFYAPQTFCDDAGRWILVGWMGTFDPHYDSAPDGLGWCHCLTVPRLLTRCDQTGLLLQNPVPELDALRGDAMALVRGADLTIAGRQADVVLAGISGDGTLTLDGSLQLFVEGGRLGVRYLVERHAAGRQERSIPIDAVRDLRVLVDGSAVETYVNGGAVVFSCRWFCDDAPDLVVRSEFEAHVATAWTMDDVMSDVYATAQAPDLAWPGWNRSKKL
jgi:beta-fructofuranosidase